MTKRADTGRDFIPDDTGVSYRQSSSYPSHPSHLTATVGNPAEPLQVGEGQNPNRNTCAGIVQTNPVLRRSTPAELSEDAQRFFAKTKRVGDCLLWTSGVQSRGYGCFSLGGGRSALAHRWAYEHKFGPIPDGLTIDHVKARGCTSKRCVDWRHLEAVTSRINTQRYAATITHCVSGHPLSGDNLQVRADGRRRCIACNRAYSRESWRRMAARLRSMRPMVQASLFDEVQP